MLARALKLSTLLTSLVWGVETKTIFIAVGLERNQTISASGLHIKYSALQVAKQSNFSFQPLAWIFQNKHLHHDHQTQNPLDTFGVLKIKSLDNRVRQTLTVSKDCLFPLRYFWGVFYKGTVTYKCINFLVPTIPSLEYLQWAQG